MWPPRSRTSCRSLPPEGAAAPAARQSRFRGPGLNNLPPRSLASRSSLPSEGGAAPAVWQSVPQPRLEGTRLTTSMALTAFTLALRYEGLPPDGLPLGWGQPRQLRKPLTRHYTRPHRNYRTPVCPITLPVDPPNLKTGAAFCRSWLRCFIRARTPRQS